MNTQYLAKTEEVAGYQVTSFAEVTDRASTIIRVNTANKNLVELIHETSPTISASYGPVDEKEYNKHFWSLMTSLHESKRTSLPDWAAISPIKEKLLQEIKVAFDQLSMLNTFLRTVEGWTPHSSAQLESSLHRLQTIILSTEEASDVL